MPDTSDQVTRVSPTNTSFRNAFRRPSTAQSGLRISSKAVHGSLQPRASFSSFAKACPTSSDLTVQEQLLESQRSCHQLQADNAVHKEALASSAVPQARPVRPQSAGLPIGRAVLSRSSSAVLPISSQGQDSVDEHSSLKGQLAGLKLQLSAANNQTKLDQAEAAAAKGAARVSAEVARAAMSCARVDALVLSEALLRVQLGEAEERINLLVSQHDQKQQKADKRVMLAEHQLQDLQQQLTDSQKLHKQLLQSLQLQQQQVEADREGAKAAQSAAEASRVEADEQARMADDVIKQLRQQLQEQAASHDAQVHALKGDLVQQGEVHRAQTAAQQTQVQALQSQNQEVCLSQRVRQHPWVGRGSGLNGRPHSAMPSSSSSAEGRELQQLTDRMGEVERLHSIVARDAAAMKAMGVLVEAKALKLDVHGSRPSSAGTSLTQTIRLQQQVRELQLRLQHAQVPKPE
ncbi:hypothetical protein WJX82_011396 [Trebouxia sp. C0006]